MKIHFLTVILLAAFASGCTINMGETTANKGVSNTNAPTNDSAVVKAEKASTTDVEKNTKNNSSKAESSMETGQNSERVEFAPGKTVTNLTRTIPANGSVDFIFNARSGQRMQYSVIYDSGSDTDIEAFLTEPGQQDISNASAANENNEFMIKKTGDHRITVNNTTGDKVSVQLGLSIK